MQRNVVRTRLTRREVVSELQVDAPNATGGGLAHKEVELSAIRAALRRDDRVSFQLPPGESGGRVQSQLAIRSCSVSNVEVEVGSV